MPDPIVTVHNAAIAECRAAVVAAIDADPLASMVEMADAILSAIDALRTDR